MEPAAEPRVGAFEPMSEPMTRSPARSPLTLPRPEVSVPIPRSYSHQKVPCNLEPRLLALEQNVGRNADLCAKIEGFFERVTARVDALESNQLAKDILVDLQVKMRSIEQEWEKADFVRVEKMTDTMDQEQEWKAALAKHKEELDETLKVRMSQHKKDLDRAVLRLNERFDTMAKDIFSLKSNSITFQDQTSQQILDLKTTYSKHGQELQQLQNFRELRESWLETFEKRMVEVEDSVAYSEKVHVESSHALRVHLESLQAEVEDSLQEVCSVHADYGARVGKIEQYLAKPFYCAPQAYGEPLAASEPQSTLRIPIPPKRGPTSQPDVAHEPRSISKNAQQQ